MAPMWHQNGGNWISSPYNIGCCCMMLSYGDDVSRNCKLAAPANPSGKTYTPVLR
jgi:hypothetical protein